MNKIKRDFDLILGILIIIYVVSINLIVSNKVAFSEALTIIGCLLIMYHFIKDRINNNIKLVKIKKMVNVLIIIGLIGFSIIEIMLVAYPKNNKDDTDYLIVLGAGLNDGDKVSLALKDRLDATLDCVNKYNNKGYIVVSGGQGKDEKISEAEAMKNYLINKGISEDKILVEDKSINTSENFMFSKEIIEEHSEKPIYNSSVKVITTDFHSFRSNILANKNGYKDIKVYASKSISYLIPIFYIREAFAVVKSAIFD